MRDRPVKRKELNCCGKRSLLTEGFRRGTFCWTCVHAISEPLTSWCVAAQPVGTAFWVRRIKFSFRKSPRTAEESSESNRTRFRHPPHIPISCLAFWMLLMKGHVNESSSGIACNPPPLPVSNLHAKQGLIEGNLGLFKEVKRLRTPLGSHRFGGGIGQLSAVPGLQIAWYKHFFSTATRQNVV